ncbi:MAG TPA: hypothetical protein DD490_00905 [Acidobacteria bacterium]|nr:hypothetical protein [Acidobacteriota bacterium]
MNQTIGRRMRRRHFRLLLLLCLAPWACAPRSESPTSSLPREAVAIDGLAPANSLDGHGSLFLGGGWGRPEGSGEPGDWGSMAWAVGREAEIHALLPPGGAGLDLYARCLPFPWNEGSPLQTFELLVDGRVVGRAELRRDWQDLRLPLPDGLPGNRLLTLRLRFAHALRPVDLGLNGDTRQLAAACTQLAILPRPVPDARAFVAAHAFEPETGRAVLPPGGGLRLPLPPASRIHLELGGLRARCSDCRLTLEIGGSAGADLRRVDTFDLSRHDEVQVDFETVAGGPQNLWLRVEAPPATPSGDTVELVLREAAAHPLQSALPAAPHVFLYVIDTVRADALEAAPRFQELARDAVLHTRARAASSWTLPSVASLLTGLYPDRHGVMSGRMQYDPQRTPSLQTLLGGRGYRSVGISQSVIVSPAYGMEAGFARFFLNDQLNSPVLNSQRARALLESWLSEAGGGAPLFAYLHTVDPHAPYTPPAGFRPVDATGAELPVHPQEGLPDLLMAAGKVADRAAVSRLRALYDGEIRHADLQLGLFIDLLKWLDLYDRSLIVVTGDHGEEFVEHGGFEHGRTLYEEALRVPLLVKYPGGRGAGTRSDEAVSLVDVAPTVLAVAGLVPGDALDGRLLPGPGVAGRRRPAIYAEVAPALDPSLPQVDLRAVMVDNLKCLENRTGVDREGRPAPPFQSFDLALDPGELHPLPQNGTATARCRELLEGWSRSSERRRAAERSQRTASPEAFERLRALGYLD